jgi:hypothetical protein
MHVRRARFASLATVTFTRESKRSGAPEHPGSSTFARDEGLPFFAHFERLGNVNATAFCGFRTL